VLAERNSWVAAVVGAKPEARITLTYPALESSRHAAFLVAGDEKRAIFRRLRDGDNCLPAARLRAIAGVTWFLDRAAAGAGT
jgi:6-phosphogluconolactonase